jgi:hypothetical protein
MTLQEVTPGENRLPETLKITSRGEATKIAESREEAYFTLLIDIY